jgi:transposase InsO family protein
MDIKLHANARTTPKTRAYIQASPLPVSQLARELGISETSVRRWRGRTRVTDGSHVRHHLGQSMTLEEEDLICGLRQDAGLSLDDLCEVIHRCVNPNLSRSAVHRCLKRHGLSAPRPLKAPAPAGQFAGEPFGYVHVDLKHLTRLEGRPAYVFVAIERTTRFAHVEIVARRDAATIAACLERFLTAFGHPVHTILTDNGSEFTDRFAVDMKGKPKDRPSGRHPFDLVCKAHTIRHRLTQPFRPQTNGMAERFNRRLAEAIRARAPSNKNRGKNRFDTHQDRNAYIRNFVNAYNKTRLKCLAYKSPLETLSNLTGLNTFAGMTKRRRCA